MSNENYGAAINLLKERYGNNQLIVDTHSTEITDMPPASNKTTSLRAMYHAIKQHLKLLHSLGEDISQRQIISFYKK